jgi:S1-C subfamily serine protease
VRQLYVLLVVLVAGCVATAPDGLPIGSVVSVTAPSGIGSGTVIRAGPQTEVLTAAHVVESAADRRVVVVSFAGGGDNQTVADGVVVRVDYAADLAVVRVPGPMPNTKPADFLPSGEPHPSVSEPVLSATCVAGLGPTPTAGMVSAVGVTFEGVRSTIVTATMVPGSSGGGVFVSRGGRWYYAGMARAVVVASGHPVFGLVYVTPVEFVRAWLHEDRGGTNKR